MSSINPSNRDEEQITVIRNYYLKNIQTDLLEERTMEEAKTNGDIVYVSVKLQGVLTTVMIDTGANISLIDKTELNRIEEITRREYPHCQ